MNQNPFQDMIFQFSDTDIDEHIIPLFSLDEEGKDKLSDLPDEIGILPLRNTVLFPGVALPITVGRDKSIRLVKEAYKNRIPIGVLTQQKDVDDPNGRDLYPVGTIAVILKMLRMPDGTTTIIIQGRKRFEVTEFTDTEPYLRAKYKVLQDEPVEEKEQKALVRSLKEMSLQMIDISPQIPSEAAVAIRNIDHIAFLIHFIASNLDASLPEKQEILSTNAIVQRAEKVMSMISRELNVLKLSNEINSKVKVDLDKQQRDYYLRQQLKTIQEELGDNYNEEELQKLYERASRKKWPEEIAEVFLQEMDKLERMSPAMPDYSVTLTYVTTLLDLPWGHVTKDKFDLEDAAKILDKDHFGLEKVKERILEYLAVLKLKANLKAPILCLYGPPGVGKTSLGKSIARALGRKFIRMSLGGVRDEAEIRGHRKTYIGAMPGRIIKGIKKAGSSNPVFILDEIDKVGNDFRGDPSSALLEVLDPEQNNAFNDHYLEVDYDLSKVLFIATANNLESIHPALRDRMEIIEINGYTIEEKIEIARQYLIPKQEKEHGIKRKYIKITDELLRFVIEGYTRESGVRNLERKIAGICRNLAKSIAKGEKALGKITEERIIQALGQPMFENDLYQQVEVPGVMIGLAWTQVGGDILFIEVSLSRGNGKLTLTGQLGEVMKESAVVAMAYLRAHADALGIDHMVFNEYDVHIHIPEGAIPKDGPSAGITLWSALASAFTGRKARPFVAMTGEITLRGKVLPVGGIKEKILAARRAGIQDIILCKRNERDILEIKAEYREGLNFHYVDSMMEVLNISLTEAPLQKREAGVSTKKEITIQ